MGRVVRRVVANASGGALPLPSILVIALGLWWNANTIAHNFLHRPFFQSRALNRGYSMFLSVLLGVPQSVWRDRHLAHHVGRAWRPRVDLGVALDTLAVAALWTTLA
jgi:fatty acid desaturase